MATTITAATIGPVLRTAADWVAGLTHYRVSRNEVHAALRQAAEQDFNVADAALNALATHMAAHGDDPQWLNRHAQLRPRDDFARLMRAAADAADVTPFDWTSRPQIVPVQRGEC
ncbi:hypothetical protein MF672_039095 [Actinomadura sp. ATCC 31491]|uniref:Uncharacterized protein n=1 Tax=Actinomadura luzonensis TaxID=2805427 RepID=A0ABT0G580_9ACTN|nr:hypothetical protein [Actinomadura luzonensis]MCK2219762.1 hypothetical protein [Actinomadura luzonensis]